MRRKLAAVAQIVPPDSGCFSLTSFPDPTAIAFFGSDMYVLNQMVKNEALSGQRVAEVGAG